MSAHTSKNSDVVDVQLTGENLYSVTIGNECMSKGTMYVGFEVYDESGYVERYEPLKVYIDGFINLGNNSSENVYVVTVDVAETETLEPDASAYVENVGTQKDMRLKLGIPRGKDGEPGYSPIKGKDYFTAEEQQGFKADILAEINPVLETKADNESAFDYYYETDTLNWDDDNYKRVGIHKIHVNSSSPWVAIVLTRQWMSGLCQLKILSNQIAFRMIKSTGEMLDWVGYVNQDALNEQFDEKIGDIETALDTIIEMQNELTGGVEV